ncbi:MAG: hypothetical protein AB1505_02000 [Candidatus Latescibacterota bacterium]
MSPCLPIGSRREPFVDDALIERLSGRAELRLHHPTPREVSLVTDQAWEGNGTNYVTVFQDGQRYRMYYRGCQYSYLEGRDRPNHPDVYCYAESTDGIHWTRPDLGLFEWDGSRHNNIVWTGGDGANAENFAPFRDTNPACDPKARYKALGVGRVGPGLYAAGSPDGIHWSLLAPEPVITLGDFDSHNLGFWDSARGEYREYHRQGRSGRDIRTSASADFVTWPEPEFLSYRALVDPGRGSGADADVRDPVGAAYPQGRVSELYTNQIAPYHRAPHLLLGFPTRYIDRAWTESARLLPNHEYRQVRATRSRREGTAVTDGMLMSSRDRQSFTVWPESFLRPGLRLRDSWFYGDTYQAWGLVETNSDLEDAPNELSLYVTERTLQPVPAQLRRYTLRLDGFVSVRAPLAGGEMLTRTLSFSGARLEINFATSAAGTLRVEIQDEGGQAVPGFTMADCHEQYGDQLDRTVSWAAGSDVSRLSGLPVRLRVELRDADLFALRFVG